MNVTLRLKSTPTLRLRYQPGLTGPAGTISVGTVTTGAAGSSATITNSGTTQAAVLNFTIPRGDQGDQGDQGDKGWTPELAVVSDGTRRVQQVVDWFGGEGTKPATGEYVGATGLETLIANGVDIRGAAGTAAIPDGDKGDITTSAGGDTWVIDNSAVTTAKIADGAVTLAKQANIATASLLGRATASTGVIEVLTGSTATDHLGTFARTGSVIRSWYAESTTLSGFTTTIPFDDTIPQSSEGSLLLSIADVGTLTSTNKLRIRFSAYVLTSTIDTITAAAFNGNADALIAKSITGAVADNIFSLCMEGDYTPNDTATRTHSIRLGTGSGTALFVNGISSARRLGGAGKAVLVIEEIKG